MIFKMIYRVSYKSFIYKLILPVNSMLIDSWAIEIDLSVVVVVVDVAVAAAGCTIRL